MSPKEQIPLFQEQKKRMIHTGERFPSAILIQLPFLSKVVAFLTSCIPVCAIVDSDNSVVIPSCADQLGHEGVHLLGPRGDAAERAFKRAE